MPRGGARKAHKLRPQGKRANYMPLDKRTWQYKLEARLRAELVEHVGGAPSVAQRLLIDRCARIAVLVSMFEADMLKGGSPADHPQRRYLAWANTLRRTLEALGMERPQQAPKRLADVLRVKAA